MSDWNSVSFKVKAQYYLLKPMCGLSWVDRGMLDLEIAKERLRHEDLGLSIVREGRVVYESASRGLFGLLEAIDNKRTVLKGTSIADRVVGKAVALLCVYAGVEAVFAITLSREGKRFLDDHSVHSEFDGLVDAILDANQVDKCPFERLVADISSPSAAYEKILGLCEHLQRDG